MFQKCSGIKIFFGFQWCLDFVEVSLCHSAKRFVGDLSVSEMLWYGKKLWLRRGYHVFRSKSFRLTLPKNFVLNPSMFHKYWGVEIFKEYLGVSRSSTENF